MGVEAFGFLQPNSGFGVSQFGKTVVFKVFTAFFL
jgi:hypothetical protein